MRKISILMIVLLHSLAGALHAQGNAVLNSLYSKMSASCVSMDYSFTMNSSDVKVVGNGSVMVQDSAYSMTGNGLQIICDGKTVGIIDAESKEVMIESPSQGDEAYMDNPALLFVNLSDAFSVDGVKKNDNVSTYVMSPMVACGIKAIWNFANAHLEVPGNILVQYENMATSLAVLSMHLQTQINKK